MVHMAYRACLLSRVALRIEDSIADLEMPENGVLELLRDHKAALHVLGSAERGCVGFWGVGFRIQGFRTLAFSVQGFGVSGFRVLGFRVLGFRDV